MKMETGVADSASLWSGRVRCKNADISGGGWKELGRKVYVVWCKDVDPALI